MSDAVSGWDTFYVIIGSSAAALTGLMFVVVSLTTEMRMEAGATAAGVAAYSSPTIVHFCLVILLASVLTSPKHTALSLGISVGAVALIGLGYMVVVVRRIRTVTQYNPVGEDWLWHTVFPLIAYIVMGVCAAILAGGSAWPLYFVAASALLLLYTGIHNAWDTATWMAISQRQSGKPPTGTNAV
jgi:hypothetical protein